MVIAVVNLTLSCSRTKLRGDRVRFGESIIERDILLLAALLPIGVKFLREKKNLFG